METSFKRAINAFFVFLALVLSPFAYAKPAAELPHFFPAGIATTTVPSEQWSRYKEYLKQSSSCQVPNEKSPAVSYYGSMKVTRKIQGKDVVFSFDPWRRELDGKIYYSDYCGRRLVSEHEFKVASEWLINHYIQGAHEVFVFHKDLDATIIANIAKAEKKTEAEVRKALDAPVPELADLSPPVSFREFQQIPAAPLTERDFVQTEVHFAHAEFLGAVWLNTELVFLTLQGAMMDFLIGRPSVVIHELTHGNEKLQDLVFGQALDVEYLASIPEMLLDEDQMSLMFHSYFKTAREMIRVTSGFDFVQVRKEVILFNHDGASLRVDPVALDKYARQLDDIKRAYSKHYREYVLPELYRNKIYWASLNNKLMDSRGMLRVMAMQTFDPTILGGHAPTMKWLGEHNDEIMVMANSAFKKSNGEDSSDADGNMKGRKSSLRALMHLTGLDEEALREIAEKYHITKADVAGLTEAQLLEKFFPIFAKEVKMGKQPPVTLNGKGKLQ